MVYIGLILYALACFLLGWISARQHEVGFIIEYEKKLREEIKGNEIKAAPDLPSTPKRKTQMQSALDE